MKLNKLNFLKENIRNLYSSGVIYLGLLISFIPPILVTFFILKTQGISLESLEYFKLLCYARYVNGCYTC